MDQYIEAEIKLFRLLYPERDIRDYQGKGPRWARNNADAFSLMVEYSCYPRDTVDLGGGDIIIVNYWNGKFMMSGAVQTAHYSDREAAVRMAIVEAVIEKIQCLNKIGRQVQPEPYQKR